VLSGESYAGIRDFIRNSFIILGVISLPGDAFRHADARVKTSILVLRLKKEDEEQGDVFMEQSVYQGLTLKTGKRIGIVREELDREKPIEADRIVSNFGAFRRGITGNYVVSASKIQGRLDVKYCLGEVGRRRTTWRSKALKVEPLENHLKEAMDRKIVVDENVEYTLLKVTYDGEVLEAERKFGEESSYKTLYRVRQWDILSSNINVGRGAIGIVPTFLEGCYVSGEYTILTARNREDAAYYSGLLRTKEILGDILASTTGMGRGRLHWNDMKLIEVPVRDEREKDVTAAVEALAAHWQAHEKLMAARSGYLDRLADALMLDGEDSRLRWLAYKPPG
jgi:type I restriction enzyme M protein